MADETSIYALVDPRDGRVRYIGTANDPERRLQGQLVTVACRGTSRKGRWLCELAAAGYTPGLAILERVPVDAWRAAELRWIEHYRAHEPDLCNAHDQPSQAWRRPVAPAPLPPAEMRAFRRECGWSQATVANALGVHYSTVSRWEAGQRPIPPTVRLALESLGHDR